MQQINLYLPEFRPSREPLRTIHMAWGLLGIFIVLILVSVFNSHQHTQLLQQLTQAQQAQQTLQAQLQILTPQKSAQPDVNVDVDAKIQQLQKVLQRRQQVFAMISSQSLGNQKGFSAQLTTLAQASLNTISLETFSLQRGGTYAELSGKARSADQIPLYLQKLRTDPSFANVGFGVMNVERDKNNNGLLQFSLAKSKPSAEATTAAAAKIREAEQDAQTREVMHNFLAQPEPEKTTRKDKP